jgi:hypothetical protein
MPPEIDIHFKCYTFEPWDVEYDLLGILRLVQFQNRRIQILCLWWFCRLASFSCPWGGCLNMQAMRLERIEDMSRHQGSCVHGDKLKK